MYVSPHELVSNKDESYIYKVSQGLKGLKK